MHRTDVGRKWDQTGTKLIFAKRGTLVSLGCAGEYVTNAPDGRGTEVGPNRDEVDFCKEGHLGVPWLCGGICNKCTGRKWDGSGTKLGRNVT